MTMPIAGDPAARAQQRTTLLLRARHARDLRRLLRDAITDTCSNRKAAAYETVLFQLDPPWDLGLRGVLAVNTRHLRGADRCFLDGHAALTGAGAWLLRVDPDKARNGMPFPVWTVMVLARNRGCDYVLLDSNAPLFPELLLFDGDGPAAPDARHGHHQSEPRPHATVASCGARDVPAGHSWAFRDHRPLGEIGMTDHDLLLAIQELLDGVEWTADTLGEIATLLQHGGYQVRDLDDRRRL